MADWWPEYKSMSEEVRRLRARNAALVETLEAAPCPVDNRARIGECQQCGCTAGLLIKDEQASQNNKGETP